MSSQCTQEAEAYAEENGLLFMETSAKTAVNVNEIFMAIGLHNHFLYFANGSSSHTQQPRSFLRVRGAQLDPGKAAWRWTRSPRRRPRVAAADHIAESHSFYERGGLIC